ncbi:hypothetical protein GGQ80_001012 [Sphingomonas jinjuensis]|uniref:Tyr recombinase domain-containing protein n=1 Tax=Sphingomonas jinjuensis TaxID=535907 RepID=A0A840FBH2_9SPHN|nr:tyrosine-type recombinase/integrase [Sphingomonas jinjuensis]MBB4153124.1 hypothetical protein [Sphingomonas jinjuensis]
MCEFTRETGLRLAEYVELRHVALDRVERTITVEKGKGNKLRVVPLTAQADGWRPGVAPRDEPTVVILHRTASPTLHRRNRRRTRPLPLRTEQGVCAMIRMMTAGTAALAMLATPVAASAGGKARGSAPSASALSLSPTARAGTAGKRSTKLGQQGYVIAGVLALGVVAGGIILVARDDNNGPSSN